MHIQPSKSSPGVKSTAGMNALIVVPDTTTADILLKALKAADFGSIYVVDRIQHALDQLDWSGQPVDLVVTVLQLFDGDAFELIDKLEKRRYGGAMMFVADSSPILLECATDLAEKASIRVIGSYNPPLCLRSILWTLEKKMGALKSADENDQSGLIAELRTQLDEWCIEAVFQPKVSLEDGTVLGVEALARWNHPDYGLLPPSYFLSLAEQSRLIDDLTEEVLRQGLTLLHDVKAVGHSMTVSVNLSGHSLGRQDLPDLLRSLVASYQIKPSQVIFEVTETQMLRNESIAKVNIDRLRLMGFGISIDDYGTGYSTMARLMSLPFTELKVDRRFCHGAADREQLCHILRNCAELASNLGISIVAEGVERNEDRELVSDLGFHCVQGYCESAPLRREQLLAWLAERGQTQEYATLSQTA